MIVIKRKGQTISGSPPEVQQPPLPTGRSGEPADPASEPSGEAADNREGAPSKRGRGGHRTRFQPGQSGNPKGRPKGSRSLAEEIRRQMRKTALVTVDGKPKRRTFWEMSVQQVALASAKGSLKAFEVAAKYEAQPLGSESAPKASVETLALDDDAYLRIYGRMAQRVAKIESDATK